MTQRIARCLAWVRAFFAFRTRERHETGPQARTYRSARKLVVRPWDPPHAPWARRRRPDRPIDGDATVMVRPYLVAEEQRQRRSALLLATVGIDAPGPYVIHGVEVA
ncbi:hypothetical protein [Streptomyces sp. KR80]|uniref:hypothetical protein n=1 Tax=Streptomyces sp. KR80 TaxID=3457426 RepID=UPI003FCFF400